MKNSVKHLALIMDGNRQWAKRKKHHSIFGYIQGTKACLNIIKHCRKIKIPVLSLFVLSTENLKRSKQDIENFKKLFTKALKKHSCILFKNQIRLEFIGDLSVFSKEIQDQCLQLQDQTKHHKALTLILALNYGGRQEILRSTQKIFPVYLKNPEKFKNITEEEFHSYCASSQFPEPDLIIRTGGHLRLSNFYLWSMAYSELYFTKTLWPDFSPQHLEEAIEDFYQRKRHFGCN